MSGIAAREHADAAMGQPATMTTAQLQARLIALRANFDKLPL